MEIISVNVIRMLEQPEIKKLSDVDIQYLAPALCCLAIDMCASFSPSTFIDIAKVNADVTSYLRARK